MQKIQNKMFNFEDKKYWIFMVIVAILSYGVILTNYDVGIDDELITLASDTFLTSGRWGSFIFSSFFNSLALLPIWRITIAVIVLCFAAVAWTSYYSMVSNNTLSAASKTIFACLLISCPILSYIFVFLVASIESALCLLLAALSLMFAYKWIINKEKLYNLFISIICLSYGISFYEPCANFFITGALCGFFLHQVITKEKTKTKDTIFMLLKALIILVLAIVLKYLLEYIIIAAQSVSHSSYVSNFIKWDFSSFFVSFPIFLSEFFQYLKILFSQTIYFKVFILSSIAFLAFTIYMAIIKKKYWLILNAFLIVLSIFAFNFLTGYAYLQPRMFLVYAIYSAFVWMMIYHFVTPKALKSIALVIVVFLVFYNTKEMTQNFTIDYLKYQLDSKKAYSINEEIQKISDNAYSKPVIFLGANGEYNNIGRLEIHDSIGKSIFNYNVYEPTPNSYRLSKFFACEGFQYIYATPEQTTQALAEKSLADMPSWPKDGSIQEFNDYIIVKLGEVL
ncbi:MAG: glucosyltransferase domain-containing protein [Christensenellaceae bacterium]